METISLLEQLENLKRKRIAYDTEMDTILEGIVGRVLQKVPVTPIHSEAGIHEWLFDYAHNSRPDETLEQYAEYYPATSTIKYLFEELK